MIVKNKAAFGLLLFYMVVCLCLLLIPGKRASAAVLKDPDNFGKVQWEYDHEASVIDENGWTQAMCSTDKYLVCLENGQDGEPDTLIAFYKTDKDEDGYTVPQYSYAKHVRETDYEHGNGMTFNPDTNELLIATGGPKDPANKGCLMVADADTLEYKRTVKVTDMDVFFSGVDYNPQTGQYVLQMGRSGGYSFLVADSDFHILYTIDGIKRKAGTTFQDFCVFGDYIVSVSYVLSSGVNNYIQVYSISDGAFVGRYYIDFADFEEKREAEDICQIEPGKFIISTGVSSPKRIRFYSTTVPVLYDIEASAANGTVNMEHVQAEKGGGCTISYQPDKNHELESVTVDGKEMDVEKYPSEYTFTDVDQDHQISVRFKKVPKFKIETNATGGTIRKTKSIFRDRDYKVTYEPDENFEPDAVLVDGRPVGVKGHEMEYTFENITANHKIEVRFKEKPAFSITAKVHGGTITKGCAKVYRDTDYAVKYQPGKDASLLCILVDGRLVGRSEFAGGYLFENVRQNHSIRVIYVKDFIPLCMIAGCVIAVLLMGYLILTIRRRKRRIIKGKRKKKM